MRTFTFVIKIYSADLYLLEVMVFVTLSDKAALFLDKQDAHLNVTKFRENKEDEQKSN